MELIVETSVFDDERLSDDVQEVQQVASTAMDIAGNNSQYFWCTEVGTDTGVHITLTPQDTFKANPSGYNLLARNNGVEVRDGLTACSVFTNGGTYFNAMLNGTNQLVAKYEASGAQIGAELSGYRNITIDNTNGIRFRNGTVNLAHYNIGSVVFYDGDTTTNHELMNLGTTGMTLKNSSGYNTFYVGNNGLIMYDGADNSHDLLNLNTSGLTLKGIFNNTLSNCAIYGADGLIVYGYTNSTTRGEIARIYSGLGNTQTSGTTTYGAYYTFGTRSSNTATTIGNYSFVEGYSNTASGYCSHAEGYSNTASKVGAHVEGGNSIASGLVSHAEGWSNAVGDYSHSQNEGTKAQKCAQTVIGTYNYVDYSSTTTHPRGEAKYGKWAFIIGNGTTDSSRSNAFTVEWNGNVNIPLGAKYKINEKNLAASDVGAISDSQIQAGSATFSSTVGGSTSDKSVTFGTTYSTAPKVVVGFRTGTGSTASNFGSCSVAVISTSTTGATFRLFNNSGASKSPSFDWIAFGA